VQSVSSGKHPLKNIAGFFSSEHDFLQTGQCIEFAVLVEQLGVIVQVVANPDAPCSSGAAGPCSTRGTLSWSMSAGGDLHAMIKPSDKSRVTPDRPCAARTVGEFVPDVLQRRT
jgi:hypothetical protein